MKQCQSKVNMKGNFNWQSMSILRGTLLPHNSLLETSFCRCCWALLPSFSACAIRLTQRGVSIYLQSYTLRLYSNWRNMSLNHKLAYPLISSIYATRSFRSCLMGSCSPFSQSFPSILHASNKTVLTSNKSESRVNTWLTLNTTSVNTSH